MNVRLRFSNTKLLSVLSLVLVFLLNVPAFSEAYTRSDLRSFQRSIIDSRQKLNRRFKKVKRKKTKYIIVHTSELGLKATLKVVSKGKRLRNGKSTHGGHTHYVIGRNGRTYRILDKRYKADHAGLSMWNGEDDISKTSIGIELAGYHYASISENQYRSLGILIDILQKVYDLDDRAVLTHSQVAYGKPNRWFKKKHRGRKRCAKNFIHAKAEVRPGWTYDPDVRAGRLIPDPQLAKVFYGRQKYYAETDDTNIISRSNTAWSIAGEDYDDRTTAYKFPNGNVYTGDQIADTIGWSSLPANTIVLLNQENGISLIKSEGPVKTISDRLTAWSFAGKKYNHKTTIYFLPSGKIKSGSQISDWDDLPVQTKLIVDYRGPFKLQKNRSAYGIAGHKYKDRTTIYYLPSQKLMAGNEIDDFTELPKNTLMFLPST
ncbi:MAG: N-acetylmuramoyl-L-alanine amidase [Nitrospira bacterium SG8_35_4]|nr:MAG: N-acetylmuramoyl-L-alanine amidase [Nitrospira bacterium SG8_35_4]